MKKLENKKLSFKVEQFNGKEIVETSVETTCIDVLYNPSKRAASERGYSWDLIEKITRVKDLYEENKDKIGETIMIEDADFLFMKERFLTNNSWTTFDKSLLEMKKYIESL